MAPKSNSKTVTRKPSTHHAASAASTKEDTVTATHAAKFKTSTTSTTSLAHASQTTANATNQETTPMTTTTTQPTASAATTPTTSPVPNPGLPTLVAQLTATLTTAEAQLGPVNTGTTSTEKRRTGKPRKGSDKILSDLAPVVRQFGLGSSALDPDQMLATSQTANTLAPLLLQLQKITKQVGDMVFNAQAESWDMGLQLYALLRRRAKTDGNVELAIAPLEKSFSYRHKSVTATKPSKTATRLKSRLNATIALAEKHGVKVTVGADGSPIAITGDPAAVQAAQAEVAATASASPAATPAPAPAPSPTVATPAAAPKTS